MTAKPHSDFYETVRKIRMAVARNRALKPRDKLVVVVMLERVNREMFKGMRALLTWASVETVAEDSALSTRDVERARSALLAAGVIERDRPGGRGHATRMRFRLDWLDREEDPDDGPGGESADTGVGDRGVGQSADLATEPPAFGDKTRDFCPTRESPKPFDLTREPPREGARDTRHADFPDPCGGSEPQLHDRIARRIGGDLHAQWFRDCRLSVTGDRVLVITAPSRFVADQIRQRFSDNLIGLGRIRDVEVLTEPRLPGQGVLWPGVEGRA